MEEAQILNSKKGLDLVDNDMELYRILMETFVSDTKFEPEELKKLVAEKKNSEAASYVHAVKGAGRQIGTEKLAEAGQKLEDVLRGKANGNIDFLSKKVVAEYKAALDAVKSFLAE